jgi:GTP-binding protein HflX
MARQSHHLSVYLPKVLLLGIQAPYNRTKNIESYFQEFRNLAKSNGVIVHEEMYIKLRDTDSGYFLTKGKLAEIREFCDKNNIEEVIISEPLTPVQERNLEDALNVVLYDRTHLILEIFEKSAHTAEGKTQVAIAMIEYQKTRLAGKGIYMAQQSGFIGMRGGPGETQKEKEKRHLANTVLKLRRELVQLQKVRDNQRKQRVNNRVPHICLIGYTNAGKSTILNALTKSNILAENKLFSTLDTTTRELYIGGQKKGVISDTVGFIQLLPPHLIEAFKSTLSELQFADLLIHVVDISDSSWQEHIKVVHEILSDLEVDKPMVYVFNKVDGADPLEVEKTHAYTPHVITSALSKEGLKPLIEYLAEWNVAPTVPLEKEAN